MISAYILADLPYTVYTLARAVFDKRYEKLYFVSLMCLPAVVILKLFAYYTFKGVYRRRLNRILADRYLGCLCKRPSQAHHTGQVDMALV
jgi:presenilin-like A22 family membrane protease